MASAAFAMARATIDHKLGTPVLSTPVRIIRNTYGEMNVKENHEDAVWMVSGFGGAMYGHCIARAFALGMLFFLVLALLQNAFAFRQRKGAGIALALYHAGLNVTVLGLLLRGLAQATGTTLARGMDAALSGISGLGHMALGAGLVWLLVAVAKATGERERANG